MKRFLLIVFCLTLIIAGIPILSLSPQVSHANSAETGTVGTDLSIAESMSNVTQALIIAHSNPPEINDQQPIIKILGQGKGSDPLFVVSVHWSRDDANMAIAAFYAVMGLIITQGETEHVVGVQCFTVGPPGDEGTVNFLVNLTELTAGHFPLHWNWSAYINVADETAYDYNLGNNIITDDWAWILRTGDIYRKDKLDILDISDLVYLLNAVGSTPGDPDWNWYADLNGDNLVDNSDVAIFYDVWQVELHDDEYPPEPFIAHPYNCSLIYGNMTEISVVEMHHATNIIATAFEYSLDGLNWIKPVIDIDYDFGDGWRTIWNLAGLSEGDYFIRVIMVNNVGQTGEDLIHVYFDPTPPIPEMPSPTFPTIFSGYANLTAKTPDENVIKIEYLLYNISWTDYQWENKSVAKLNQHDIDNGTLNDPYNGSQSCGPTATASCLAYWDAYVAKDGSHPYDNLYDETIGDNDNDGYPDGLEEMARELYNKAKTNRDDRIIGGARPPNWAPNQRTYWPGTFADNLRDGINSYIKDKNLEKKLEAELLPAAKTTLENIIKEFLRSQDVIVLMECPGNNEQLEPGRPGPGSDDYGHYVTISSLHFKFMWIDIFTPIPVPILIGIDIDYMDPGTGQTKVGSVNLTNNQIKADWNNNGTVGNNEFASVWNVITVCPKSPGWVPIGTDFDGSDGWSVDWDTTQLPDKFYLVKATMTDATNNTGTDIILVYVDNARITDITPTKTVVGEGYSTDIQVSIENLFVESASFNITVYGNETLIGTENVTLASQTSTTLVFTWNTTGFAKGNYTISAYTRSVLGEIDREDNIYVDGIVFVSIAGDVNGDRLVDISDLVITVGTIPSSPTINPEIWNSNADINNDGVCDVSDLVICVGNIPSSW